jgi:release factor glutamine methyltransferase
MNIAGWLFETMEKLGEAGVDSPRRDALVLLEDTLHKDRTWVLAHSDYEIPKDRMDAVNILIDRRVAREPLAYIRKKAWFYGRFFYVDENVLVPRPETETIIDLVKLLKPDSVLEIGTGSGCIAITLALEIPRAEITATDVSNDALEICRKNAYAHEVKITIKNAYLLDSLLEKSAPELLVANLPYVPDDLITSPEIEAEPKLALFAGPNGMDLYESMWAQISTSMHKPSYIITESMETQHSHMNTLAARSGYRLLKSAGLIQKFKKLAAEV